VYRESLGRRHSEATAAAICELVTALSQGDAECHLGLADNRLELLSADSTPTPLSGLYDYQRLLKAVSNYSARFALWKLLAASNSGDQPHLRILQM